MPPKTKVKRKKTTKKRPKPKPKKGEVLETKLARVGRRYVQYQLEKVHCGKPGCDKLHGPYWYAYWIHHSRRCQRYLGKRFRKMTLDMFRTVERKKKAEAEASQLRKRKRPRPPKKVVPRRSLRQVLDAHEKHVAETIADGRRKVRDAAKRALELAEGRPELVDPRQLSLLREHAADVHVAAKLGESFEIPANSSALVTVDVSEFVARGMAAQSEVDRILATPMTGEPTGWRKVAGGGTEFENAVECVDCGVVAFVPRIQELGFLGCVECGRPPRFTLYSVAAGDESAAAETPANSVEPPLEGWNSPPESPTDPAPPPTPDDAGDDSDEATRASSDAPPDASSAEAEAAPRASERFEHAPT